MTRTLRSGFVTLAGYGGEGGGWSVAVLVHVGPELDLYDLDGDRGHGVAAVRGRDRDAGWVGVRP